MKSKLSKAGNALLRKSWFVPMLLLIIVFMINGFLIRDFWKITVRDGQLYGYIIDILQGSTPLIIIAIGMTLVIATRGIDISVGAIVAISGSLVAVMIGSTDASTPSYYLFPMWFSITCAILAGGVCGTWNGFLVAELNMQANVATLILMTAGRGIAQLITKSVIVPVYYTPFRILGAGFFLGIPISIYIALFVYLFVWLFCRKTAFGMFVESVGLSRTASAHTGINIKLVIMLAFILCGMCAAVSGILLCADVYSADANNIGLTIQLDAILAVALGGNSLSGGKFNIFGSVVGAIVLQTLSIAIYSTGLAVDAIMAVKAVVVILICVVRSERVMNKTQRWRMKHEKATSTY